MIGIFDSGIGGVTVLNEILKYGPKADYLYYSDSKNNPYGEKSPEQIMDIVFSVVHFLDEKGCFLIVIACNTASAVCVSRLRNSFPHIHFIAIEPAYKMVHDYHITGRTLVMATQTTLSSEKFQTLYHTYDNLNTILYPCHGLAYLIETNDQEGILDYIRAHLVPLLPIDTIVLGCTHYPIIKPELTQLLGNVSFFDGAQGVCKQLVRQAKRHSLPTKERSRVFFYDSSAREEKKERFQELLDGVLIDDESKLDLMTS